MQVRSLHRIGVIGLGLIGGSLARRLAPRTDLVGYAVHSATRLAAQASGITVAASVAEATANRDLVVLAVPLPAIQTVLPEVLSTLDGAVLTDVGSVKLPVRATVTTAAAAGGGRPVLYVGGHPMAGTERSGFGAADPTLFDGAAWVLCLEDDTDLDSWLALAAVVTSMGCRVVPCTAADHDAALARVSGLPHVLASALAVAGAAGGPLALSLGAGSFRDGTRVAGTRPELIAALCDGNRDALAEVLTSTITELTNARDALRGGASVSPLAEAGTAARGRWVEIGDGAGTRADLEAGTGLRAELLALGAAGGAVRAVSTAGKLRCDRPRAAGQA